MTRLKTLTRKTTRVRTERKLTVSNTNVFVPTFDGMKTCRLTLVPAPTSPPPSIPPLPAIFAFHLALKRGFTDDSVETTDFHPLTG